MGLKALKNSNGPGGRCASHTHQPDPLGKASHIARERSPLRLFQYFRPIFLQLEIRTEPDAEYLALKDPGRAQPFHEPNRKAVDFSRLILAPVTTFYLPISLFTLTTSELLIISTLTSSVCAVYLATSVEPGNVRARRTGFAFNLRRKGEGLRSCPIHFHRGTHRKGEFSCESEDRNRPQTEQPPEKRCQPYQRPWTNLN